MLDKVTAESFEPLVGQLIAVTYGTGRNNLRLTEAKISRYAASFPKDMRVPFSLIFKAERPDAAMGQGTYELDFPELGVLAVFLVPIGQSEDGTLTLQAVFN